MSINKHITLQNNKFALKDLINQITAVLDQGIVTLKVKDSVVFSDLFGATIGGLRYNPIDSTVEFSNDGLTWTALSSDSFWWEQAKSYTESTVVLHNSGWYVATEMASGDDVPGTSSKWALLTAGTLFRYATNADQLKRALEERSTTISIHLKGSFTGSIAAAASAENITIWSDEGTSLSGSLSLQLPSTCNIYWHSNGSKIVQDYAISVAGGVLWLDRLTVANNATLRLLGSQSSIYYRRIDGAVEGGTFKDWISTATEVEDKFVPKDLASLSDISYGATLKVYVQDGNSYGYMVMDDIAAKIASQASAYFKIDMRGVDAIKPGEAPKGFVFYATDTGALYVMGDNNKWQEPIVLRGADGKQGKTGKSVVPKINSDRELTWELKTFADNEYPTLPKPVSLKGEPGKSALDIWRDSMGDPSKTEEDFLDALGIGSRRVPFTKMDVDKSYNVKFTSKYPLVAIQDNNNYQWALGSGEISYTSNNDAVTVNLKSVLEANGMLTDKAFIRTTYGNHYRDTSLDVAACYGWIRTSDTTTYFLYTSSPDPEVNSLAYLDPTLTGETISITSFTAGVTGGIVTELGHFSRYPDKDTSVKYCWISDDGNTFIYTVTAAPVANESAYTNSSLTQSSAIRVTEGFVEDIAAKIDTVLGTYTRHTTADVTKAVGWSGGASSSSLWTAIDEPIKGDKAYSASTLTGTYVQLLADYQPASTETEIPGTWYALFSGGGGGDGKSATVEIVSTQTTAPGTEAKLVDIQRDYFVKENIIYTRHTDGDVDSAIAWIDEAGYLLYTDTEYISVIDTLIYEDAGLTSVIGTPDKVGSASVASDRKYILSIPAGPEGRYYNIPEEFSIDKVYYPVSAAKNYYDTVLHQGSTWIYIAEAATSGNPPPELPSTSNAYWQLLAAAGADGKDVGEGISVHSMSFKKPYSDHPLHLQVMRATKADINNASLFIDTSVADMGCKRVKAWNASTSKWTEVPADGLDKAYNNQLVTVDMFDTTIEVFIFYRWVTLLNKDTKWMATTFPHSPTLDVEDTTKTAEELVIKHSVDLTYDMVDSNNCVAITPYKFVLGVVDHNGVYYEIDESYAYYDFNANSTTIDLSYVFAQANTDKVTGTWKIVILEGEQQISGVIDKYGHTHQNKSVLDNITVDVYGNVMIYGTIIVPYNQRQDSVYLVDTEGFNTDDAMLTPGDYTKDDTLVDPYAYSVIKTEHGVADK